MISGLGFRVSGLGHMSQLPFEFPFLLHLSLRCRGNVPKS